MAHRKIPAFVRLTDPVLLGNHKCPPSYRYVLVQQASRVPSLQQLPSDNSVDSVRRMPPKLTEENILREFVNFLCRITTDDLGQTWVQYLCTDPATRLDVLELEDSLDQMLEHLSARPPGTICPVRQQLHSQVFDELIRQVHNECAERGQLLFRVKCEMNMTLQACKEMFECSEMFGYERQKQQASVLMKMNEKIRGLEQRQRSLLQQLSAAQGGRPVISEREEDEREKQLRDVSLTRLEHLFKQQDEEKRYCRQDTAHYLAVVEKAIVQDCREILLCNPFPPVEGIKTWEAQWAKLSQSDRRSLVRAARRRLILMLRSSNFPMVLAELKDRKEGTEAEEKQKAESSMRAAKVTAVAASSRITEDAEESQSRGSGANKSRASSVSKSHVRATTNTAANAGGANAPDSERGGATRAHRAGSASSNVAPRARAKSRDSHRRMSTHERQPTRGSPPHKRERDTHSHHGPSLPPASGGSLRDLDHAHTHTQDNKPATPTTPRRRPSRDSAATFSAAMLTPTTHAHTASKPTATGPSALPLALNPLGVGRRRAASPSALSTAQSGGNSSSSVFTPTSPEVSRNRLTAQLASRAGAAPLGSRRHSVALASREVIHFAAMPDQVSEYWDDPEMNQQFHATEITLQDLCPEIFSDDLSNIPDEVARLSKPQPPIPAMTDTAERLQLEKLCAPADTANRNFVWTLRRFYWVHFMLEVVLQTMPKADLIALRLDRNDREPIVQQPFNT